MISRHKTSKSYGREHLFHERLYVDNVNPFIAMKQTIQFISSRTGYLNNSLHVEQIVILAVKAC